MSDQTMRDKTFEDWAPERIWLQRDAGDAEHTWCSDSQGHHEQAEYVRVDAAPAQSEAKAVGEVVSFDSPHVTGMTGCIFAASDVPVGTLLYTAPPVDAPAGVGETKAERFILGNQYRTQSGDLVRFVKVHNEGTRYETMEDENGRNRYTNRDGDMGRLTGTAHDYSDPGNTPPLYTAPPVAGAAEMGDAKPLKYCAASSDGECNHAQCPQIRDNEPCKSGRHCPLDTRHGDDE